MNGKASWSLTFAVRFVIGGDLDIADWCICCAVVGSEDSRNAINQSDPSSSSSSGSSPTISLCSSNFRVASMSDMSVDHNGSGVGGRSGSGVSNSGISISTDSMACIALACAAEIDAMAFDIA